MRSPRLAALELKRFGRGKLPRAAMAAMLLLPLLYGALYLWSFWDPYNRLDRIPVALVNEDQGATIEGDDGKKEKITAGDDIIKGLRDSNTFEWHETSAADAKKGLEDGSYYLTMTVPEDFSQKVTSSSGDHPETGALRVQTNDANNYIVGQISRTVFSEVRASATSKTSSGFYDKIFVSFSSIHESTKKAAKGADDLKDGIGKAKKGAGELADGTSDAKQGSQDLKDGLTRLNQGARDLERGAGQVAAGTQKLADKVNSVAKATAPLAKGDGEDIATVARNVADSAKTAQDHVKTLPQDAGKAAKLSRGTADGVARLYTLLCENDAPESPVDCQDLRKHADYSRTAADTAEAVNDKIQDYDGLGTLDKDLGKLRAMALDLQKKAPNLGQDLDNAVKQVNALNKGARQVHSGAGKLHTGLSSAQGGAGDLNSGLAELSSGARSLNGGLFKLADGSGALSRGLHDGAEQIPDYDKKEREDRSSVMADPVQLASGKVHTAPNYGTGFAPYFIPLSLWVGAMVAYMLLQPLNRRALAAGAPVWRTALAGWLPVAAIGALQVGALLAVLRWAPGLGLELHRAAGTIGFLLLVTACFAAIIQWLNAQFGPAGRILVLAVLMLQLTSAGGTYPVQTSPDFFNAIHPFLPMSYVVEGLRHLITGGELWPVWRACVVLLAFTAGALALTAWTARRSAVWTMKRLHPELTL
ncbi:YhgE/Pip domain-containing protein [Streptomyces gobiensis]|uniref:YhgE/Pip domain-containing protein n=1 Tax=Streptomyces gobiensis TaxID=2875706 RepID=UPI001E40A1A6|nr:YhgE/Pip domain-containing protein [Streptomyces gobiensis]UGY90889.1 YhgE/Pip domain-containing protein [Streptomyces gobiensis]